jgi:hypothetical protein
MRCAIRVTAVRNTDFLKPTVRYAPLSARVGARLRF